MASKALPSPEVLRQLLRYEPETGKLFWLNRAPALFNGTARRTPEHASSIWNTKNAGREAFTADDGDGYKTGAIFDKSFRAHRIVWAMHTGAWPTEQIDHINGIRTDNRIENLRHVSHDENCRNIKKPAHNTSGVLGVSWMKKEKKWKAAIGVDRKNRSLGAFLDLQEAATARKSAEAKFGFHENHGRD
jgi:hypothetical protein